MKNPGFEEVCDCEDNNCNNDIDEGMHTTVPLDFFIGTDDSISMDEEIGAIQDYCSTADMPDCFSGEIINVTSAITDDPPYITRVLVSVEEFQNNYDADTPDAIGGGYETVLNTIAYAACAVEGMEDNPICVDLAQSIMTPIDFRGQQIWRPDSDKYIVIFSDEQAQWHHNYSGYLIDFYNQEQIAGLAAAAGIVVDVFTADEFHNWDNYDPDLGWPLQAQGYGYFATLTGGTLYDIHEEIWNGTLGETFSSIFIDRYCI